MSSKIPRRGFLAVVFGTVSAFLFDREYNDRGDDLAMPTAGGGSGHEYDGWLYIGPGENETIGFERRVTGVTMSPGGSFTLEQDAKLKIKA